MLRQAGGRCGTVSRCSPSRRPAVRLCSLVARSPPWHAGPCPASPYLPPPVAALEDCRSLCSERSYECVQCWLWWIRWSR